VGPPAGLLLAEVLQLSRSSRSVKALLDFVQAGKMFDCCTGVRKKKTRTDNDASRPIGCPRSVMFPVSRRRAHPLMVLSGGRRTLRPGVR
jgi:hypothetical protein